ncbi:MAG: pilus assembly PilX N-terminal domain-containing protein [Candidatus Acidiferrales bacterium]
MPCPQKHEKNRSERGAALLIAIFALLLISVVGIALIVSTGTDSALTGNYRTSTSAYYAAVAGLEEARGRLYRRDPNFVGAAVGSDVHNVLYIINPNTASGETVNPLDQASPYADKEYDNEFSWHLSGANVMTPFVQSVSRLPATTPPLPGLFYKWVRINPVTETALNLDVDGDGSQDPTTPLFYDPAHLPSPGLIASLMPPPTAVQALEVTSLAVLPSGSTRMLQYIVTPVTLGLNFPAVVTLVGSSGNNVYFRGSASPFTIDGNDDYPVGGCPSGPTPVYAIGFANGSNASSITAVPAGNYKGAGGSPSVADVSALLPMSFQTPAALDSLVQTIVENADAALSPTHLAPPCSLGTSCVLPSDLPPTMSSANPMTVVVNGNLDLTNWHGTGYGLLLVTGTLIYDPDATWDGIILVIGQGAFLSTRGGFNQLNGAMLIAKIINNSGNLSFGAASFSQTGGGDGVYYNSCWVQRSQPPLTYKVLSFREIPLAN